MSLKKTACLATLCLALPLVVSSEAATPGWDGNYKQGNAGSVVSSGTEASPQTNQDGFSGEYTGAIYIGHAEHDGETGSVAASWNSGIFPEGFILKDTKSVFLYGGYAKGTNVDADGLSAESSHNVITLKSGSTISGIKSEIYGGCAIVPSGTSGTAEASSNYVTFEDGAVIGESETTSNYIYGGYANAVTAKAAGNHLKMTGVEGYLPQVMAGRALCIDAEKGQTAVASGNELVLSKMVMKQAGYWNPIVIGGLAQADAKTGTATASGNYGSLDQVVFEDLSYGLFFGGNAVTTYGTALASDNIFTITKGMMATASAGFATANESGSATARSNKLTVQDIEYGRLLYGGYALGGEDSDVHAVSNTLIISGGLAVSASAGLAKGGEWTTDGPDFVVKTAEASKNRLYLNCEVDEESGTVTYQDSYTVIGEDLYGGYAIGTSATASENKGVLVNAQFSIEAGETFAGGQAVAAAAGGTATASKNDFAILSGTYASVYGGRALSENSSSVTAESNTVTIIDAEVSKQLYGGYAASTVTNGTGGKASAKSNTVLLSEGSYKDIYGGYATTSSSTAEASGNRLYLNCTDESGTASDTPAEISGVVYGGYAEGKTATATGNKGILNNVTLEAEDGFAGGQAVASTAGGSAAASENSFAIKGGTYNNVYGGRAVSGNTSSATAQGNTLTLTSAEISQDLYGGYASNGEDNTASMAASAEANTLSLYGGTYSGDIYGGYAAVSAGTASAASNTVELNAVTAGDEDDGLPKFADTTVIYGGYASAGSAAGTSTGNTLKFNNVKNLTAGNISNFQNLSYNYTELAANEVILTLNGGEKTTFDGAVSVNVNSLKGTDGGEFQINERVVLLANDSGIDASITSKSVTVKTGASLTYDVLVTANEKKLILTRINDPEPAPTIVDSGTKAIAEGALAGLALVSESTEAVFEVIDELAEQDLFTFGTVHGGNKTYETGSNINVSSVSLLAGLGKGFSFDAGQLSVGAFFEYGKGSYTTNNSFTGRSDINGDGNSWYMGGGILARMIFKDTGPGRFFMEGSAHMGTLHNEFDSNDFVDGNGNIAKFDMDSPYYSLHGGMGYVRTIEEGHELKVYGKYMWTMVQGTDDTLTTSDKFDYEDMHSSRLRVGVRYSYTGSERFKPYIGVAYEHEFAGSCDAKAYGYDVNSPSFKGGTGIGELGFSMTPSDTLPLSLNFGVQGFVGTKQGISGTCNVVYEF